MLVNVWMEVCFSPPDFEQTASQPDNRISRTACSADHQFSCETVIVQNKNVYAVDYKSYV
jgi:hypothetical protein